MFHFIELLLMPSVVSLNLAINTIMTPPQNDYVLPYVATVQISKENTTLAKLIEKLPDDVQYNDNDLWLVNALNPLKGGELIELVDFEGVTVSKTIEQPLMSLLEAATKEGFDFTIISGYRSKELQESNRQASIANYQAAGMDYDEAVKLTDQYFAPTDASEHSTGLAVDLLGSDWIAFGGELTGDYANEPSAKWLADNAYKFGFILRYMDGKTNITGYNFEPWHYRYVGHKNAQFIHDYQLTLEEYLALLQYK